MYSRTEQGNGSSSAGGTLLEMNKMPDAPLDAAGPSNIAQQGSESSSEVRSIFLMWAVLRWSREPGSEQAISSQCPQ